MAIIFLWIIQDKEIYVDYEYLVCSKAFIKEDFYIIDAKEDNYQHLIGVNSNLKASEFFERCYSEELEEEDFNFLKRGQSERSVIGSVRRKINILPNMMELLFNENTKVQEEFVKNTVFCSFASTDDKCTLGFINNNKARPKTLVKGNELVEEKSFIVDLVIRKK